jgi:TolA-binding protein
MSNDAETRSPRLSDAARLEQAVAFREDDAPTCFEPPSLRATSRTRRSIERASAQKTAAIAIALAFAVFSLSARAEPPRNGPTSKSDASATAPKAATPGRPKTPATPAPQPPPPAAALKTETEGPEAEGKARAQAIFEQAVAAYKEGRYFDAVELFLETSRIYPDSKLCFNIARAYEGLGNSGGALRYYREYLRRTPNAADRADVENSVRQLELALSQKGMQQMSVFSTPDGAVLAIDGQPVALTPWTGETWPGKHRLTLTHPGYIEGQQVVELSPLRAVDVQVELKAEPPAKPATPLPSEQRSEQGHGIQLLTVATLAAGAVLLGTALGVQLTNDSGTSSTAAFLGGAGVGATAVGGVLFYFDVTGSRSK